MNSIQSLCNVFSAVNCTDGTENFDEFSIKTTASDMSVPSVELFKHVLSYFPERDRIQIDVSVDAMEAISYRKNNNIEDFIEKLRFAYDNKYDDSEFDISIKIVKQIEANQLSIYSLELLTTYLMNQPLKSLFFIFNKLIKVTVTSSSPLFFTLMNDNITFGSEMFKFSNKMMSEVLKVDRSDILAKQKEITSYLNGAEFNLIPEDFNFKGDVPLSIDELFKKLCSMLSLIFISDISKFEDNNVLYFRINGYKMIEEYFHFDKMSDVNAKEIYEIYQWIYSEGSISDKVGLARNIISLNFDRTKIILSETFPSIRSGYEIYLKKNIEHYIEVKNKVSEFLLDMSQKSSGIVDSFASSIKNSNMLFLSFFITIVIFNALGNNKDKIFTPEIEWISYGILIISFLFLLVSMLYSQSEKSRYKYQYEALKSMYNDLLDPKDINKIFNHDTSYKGDLKFVNFKIRIYAGLWAAEIVIIGLVVFFVANPNILDTIKLSFDILMKLASFGGMHTFN